MSFESWMVFCVTEAVLCVTPGPAVLLVFSVVTDPFWIPVLSTFRTRDRDIDELKTLVADYAGVTKERIVETLGRYLTEERHFRVIATPKKKDE